MMMLDTDGSGDGAIEDGELSKDEILDLLNDESGDDPDNPDDPDDDKDDKDDGDQKDDDSGDDNQKHDKKGDDDEDDEDKKLKKDDEDDEKGDDEDEDEEDLVTPIRRKEILKAFPDLFKKFPYLERAYYSDQQFRELFGTVDDAKEAQQKATALDGYESELMKGDTESILQAVKDGDEDAWNNIVDEYLSTLAKIDNQAYLHVLSKVVKDLVVNAAQAGKANKNQKLSDAAIEIHRHVFNTDQFTPHQKLGKGSEDTKDKDALEKERQEFLQERFETARDDLSTRVNNSLRGTVDDAIDPKDSMTAYVKKNAVKDTMSMLDQVIRADKSFMRVIDGLWKKSADVKFNSTSIKKIRSVYMSKAKTLLPAVIKRSRKEALHGSGKGSSDTGGKDRSPDSSRRSTSSRKSSSSKRSDDGSGMSTYDFLNQD